MSGLDEEILALHSEIVELQRSPFARRQGDVMEKLSVAFFFSYFLQVSIYSSYEIVSSLSVDFNCLIQ